MRPRLLVLTAASAALPWLLAAAWNLVDRARTTRLWNP